MRNENRHGWWPVNHLGAWRRIPPGAAAPAGSRARRTARYLLLVPIVALVALLLVTAMSSERPQAQAQSGDATLEADADCQVPPTDLESTLDADASGVVLTWLAPAGCTPAGYAVYRRNMSEDGSRMQQLATVGGDTLTYTDTDVEAGESYRYRVRSNDLGPRSDHTTIAVPEAEPEPAPRSDDRVVRFADPVFNTSLATTIMVPENTASGENIGSPYTATDSDTGDTLAYTLSGTDAASFSIVSTSGQLQASAALNFEVDSSYVVTVGVGDGKAADGITLDTAVDTTITVTITVTNVNEPPTITSGSTSKSVSENTATSTVIETYEASDPDTSATLTWSLSGDDAGDFVITKNASGQGELKFMNVPNYESPADNGTNNIYNVTVGVRDGLDAAGGTDSANDASVAVTIRIGNVDEAGTMTITGTLSGGSMLTSTFSDPDMGIADLSYKWARGETQGGTFTDIPSTNASSYTTVAADVGMYLQVTASYTDAEESGKSASAVTTSVIGASNAVPTFDDGTMTTRTVPENSATETNVGSVVDASDTDTGDTLTYSLRSPTGSTDASSFTVDGNGQIKTTGATYNFEGTKNSYTVIVDVRDSEDAAGNADTATDDSITVTINLTNVNEAPTVTAGSTARSFAENQPIATAISTYMASDVDASDTLTWSVEPDDDGALFAITTNSDGEGVLTFAASPNFEDKQDAGANNVYDATVKVTDGGNLSDTRAVAVTVTNVNEAPVFDPEPINFNVNENTATTTVIKSYSATDVDASTTLTWSLEGEDEDHFEIIKNTVTNVAELRFAAVPNFEDPVDDEDNDGVAPDNDYVVTVVVKDNGSPQAGVSKAIIITVVDVNDVPVVTGATPDFPEIEFDVDGGTLTATHLTVATYAAADEDVGDTTVAWSLTGGDANHFTITTDADGDGVLRFKNPTPSTALKPADYENPRDAGSNNGYDIVVRATDANSLGPLTGTFAVTVTVTNVNETPEITGGSETPTFAEIEWDASTADLEVETYHRARRGNRGHYLVPGRHGRGRLQHQPQLRRLVIRLEAQL